MYKYVKSALDFICALLGLAVLSVPLAVVALCVRLDSKGPVIFRQLRTGLGGRRNHLFIIFNSNII